MAGLAGASPALAADRALTPADFHAAYRLPDKSASPPLVAVVAPYDAPSAAADLAAYSRRFRLPACTEASGCFRRVNQSGQQGSYPISMSPWSEEAELDVEVIRGICQNCRIRLVEASSGNPGDLAVAMSEAMSLGAKVISTSFTLPETSVTADYAYAFSRPGIVVTAASGDLGNGGGPQFPASIPGVVAVGGTHLTLRNGRWGSETGWSSHGQASGSGCSTSFAAPSWQSPFSKGVCAGRRALADVSADADPDTGAIVYVDGALMVGGGTSLASPIIAGAFALAGGVAPGTIAPQLLYANARELRDITSGTNGTCSSRLCRAGVGWDGPTGLGVPDGLAAFEPTPELRARHPNVSVVAHGGTLNANGSNLVRVVLSNRNPFPVQGVLSLSAPGLAVSSAQLQLPAKRSTTITVKLRPPAVTLLRKDDTLSVSVVLQLVDRVGHHARARTSLRLTR
jgi:hypothetical protein